MIRLLPIFALFFASTAAFAQDAYKCKVNGTMVYQDSPCKAVGPAPAEPQLPDLPATNETIQRATALCETAVRNQMKDPESAKIKDIRRSRTDRWCRTPPIQVRYYWMTVNGKNSYGGYVGEKPYRCALDMGESVVLGVAQIGEYEKITPCKK